MGSGNIPPKSDEDQTRDRYVNLAPAIHAFDMFATNLRNRDGSAEVEVWPALLPCTQAMSWGLETDPDYLAYSKQAPLLLTFYTGLSYPPLTQLERVLLLAGVPTRFA